MPIDITKNISAIRQQIAHYCGKYQRNIETVKLLAVSKTQPSSAIKEAFNAGQRDFGENYLQEAIDKINALQDLNLNWHFIGHIQSNKTELIAKNFDWVHSVDRVKIATRLSQQRPDNLAPLNICLQINIDQEPTKSGFLAESVCDAIQQIQHLPNIKLRGLMSIPKPRQDFQQQQQIHQKLNNLLQRLNPKLDTLSMGMSNDLEAAISAGSTWVRIGTSIFGPRNTSKNR